MQWVVELRKSWRSLGRPVELPEAFPRSPFPVAVRPLRFSFYRFPATPDGGAKATALQTLPRWPGAFDLREAFGLRRVHRRFFPDRIRSRIPLSPASGTPMPVRSPARKSRASGSASRRLVLDPIPTARARCRSTGTKRRALPGIGAIRGDACPPEEVEPGTLLPGAHLSFLQAR